jgi:hypothetical protein
MKKWIESVWVREHLIDRLKVEFMKTFKCHPPAVRSEGFEPVGFRRNLVSGISTKVVNNTEKNWNFGTRGS